MLESKNECVIFFFLRGFQSANSDTKFAATFFLQPDVRKIPLSFFVR